MKRRPGLIFVKIAVFCLLSALNVPCVLATTSHSGQDTDWYCWRGPNGDGKSFVKEIRKDWSGGLRKVWEYDDLQTKDSKCDTWSAVSVKGSKLITIGRHDDKDVVFCFDADTGRLLWEKEYAAPGDSLWGGGARATPYIDGDRVYAFGRMGHLTCWNLKDGKRKWIRNVHDEGGLTPAYGHSSSPLVYRDLVIVQGGELRGMSTPGRIAGLNTKNGKRIWESPWWCQLDVFATTPAVSDDAVFITTGYGGGGCKLVKVSGTKATKVWEHWKDKTVASLHSDPIILDGYIYCYSGMSSGKGELQCVELKTGKLMWSAGEQVGWGTMILVNRHLLCLSNRGDLFLVEPDPKIFRKVTEFRHAIPDTSGQAWTVPVVANGKLYLRFKERLICYDLVD